MDNNIVPMHHNLPTTALDCKWEWVREGEQYSLCADIILLTRATAWTGLHHQLTDPPGSWTTIIETKADKPLDREMVPVQKAFLQNLLTRHRTTVKGHSNYTTYACLLRTVLHLRMCPRHTLTTFVTLNAMFVMEALETEIEGDPQDHVSSQMWEVLYLSAQQD